MIVGIDVHKQTHAAALIDDRGGLIDAMTIANSPKGYRQLIDAANNAGGPDNITAVVLEVDVS